MNRIISVEPISVRYREPNDNNEWRILTMCRIESADGLVGWGEAVTMWPEAGRATEALIRGLGDLLEGENPLSNVEIWRRMRRHVWWYGYRGGLASFAISAIDIALWDLRGKLTGQSLTEMLGGSARSIPVIASTHAFEPSLDDEVAKHKAYVAEMGFAGVKVGFGKRGQAHLGYELERDAIFVAALRSAIGNDAILVVDRGQSIVWDLQRAVQFSSAVEPLHLKWIEEPFEPQELQNFRAYRHASQTMIGTGEREWDERGYREVIDSGLADVIGCDPGRANGITGAQRVIQLVEDAGLWFNSHAWSSSIVTAASLALSAATTRCLVFEMKPIPNPMQDEIVTRPIRQEGGLIEPPSGPGLGIDINEEAIARYQL